MNFPESLEVRVRARRREAEEVSSFELVPTDGEKLPAFSAGAHIDVHLPNGLTRQYSLCNDASEENRYLIAVLRDPASRGGSLAIHDSVREGDTLRISWPKNHFPLSQEAQHSLLFAGGIGVTPILCMAERLSAIGRSFDMLYCARSYQKAPFFDYMKKSKFAEKVKFHFDNDVPDQKPDIAGFLEKAAPNTHLYVCGPTGFIDAVLNMARQKGMAEDHLHYEFFGAKKASHGNAEGFQVKLARSGKLVAVAKDKTIVQALADAGVVVPTSCEQGVCGTCLTRVLEGEPDHRDLYLTQDEQKKNDQFLPCCSRSKSELLVLDL
jgi:vanillate O-demethylase ferredoxin subunit